MNKHHQELKYLKLSQNWYELEGPDERVSGDVSLLLKEKGFFAGCALWYDFEKYGYDSYANDKAFYFMHPLNGWMSKLIDDKRFIPILFKDHHHLVPELSVGVEDNRIRYLMMDGEISNKKPKLEELSSFLGNRYEYLFVKPAGLSGGKGAFKVKVEDFPSVLHLFDANHAYLINNSLIPEEYCTTINPYNVSTIRVNFFRGRDNNLKILNILQRFGTVKSGFVDNIGAGGLCCEIEINKGKLSNGFAPTQEQIWLNTHPDSGFRLTDFVVPNWEGKLKQIYEILSVLHFLEFGALDIAVTNAGLRLLEVNSLPGRRLMQFNKPAFFNLEFKEFCYSKGYGEYTPENEPQSQQSYTE